MFSTRKAITRRRKSSTFLRSMQRYTMTSTKIGSTSLIWEELT